MPVAIAADADMTDYEVLDDGKYGFELDASGTWDASANTCVDTAGDSMEATWYQPTEAAEYTDSTRIDVNSNEDEAY